LQVTPNTTDDRGTPLIHAACEGGMESFVHDLLHSWKADANLLDELGNTGLHICQLFGGGEWIKLWETLEQASCGKCMLPICNS
jgi:ankyrin repeat protein